MGRARFCAVILLSLAFSLASFWAFPPELVRAEGGVEGLVLNKTGGQTPVKGQEVELKALRPDGSEESRLVAKTDDSGKFSFANLAASSSVTYTVSTMFQGVQYQTTVNSPHPAGSGENNDLVVYESTDDASLQVDLSHLVVEVDPETRDLTVLEIAIVSNPSDKTLVPGTKSQPRSGRSLWFPLPKGALHPEVTEGLDNAPSPSAEEGLGYGGPILPGKRQVVYSYMLANPSSSFTISKPLAYASRKVNVLMADVGQRISNSNLAAQQPVNIQGRSYQFLTGEAFEAGDKLELSVSNFPSPSVTGPGIGSLNEVRWIALAAVVVAGLAVAVAYPRIRGSRQMTPKHAHAAQANESTALAREKAQLLAAIAELDSKFEAGQISPEQYREQREARKQRLRQIWA